MTIALEAAHGANWIKPRCFDEGGWVHDYGFSEARFVRSAHRILLSHLLLGGHNVVQLTEGTWKERMGRALNVHHNSTRPPADLLISLHMHGSARGSRCRGAARDCEVLWRTPGSRRWAECIAASLDCPVRTGEEPILRYPPSVAVVLRPHHYDQALNDVPRLVGAALRKAQL